MRIIAGKYKRTPILTLEGDDITRPTRDMVKEALFSTISVDEDTAFLDLFSGSGSIGLEALSRGAKTVVFNDRNRDAVKIIKANLKKVREEREVYNLDYSDCLSELVANGNVEETEDGYLITETGARNADAVESSLPYSVRAKALRLIAPVEEKLRRAARRSTS